MDEISDIFILAYGEAHHHISDRAEQGFKLFRPVLHERLMSYSDASDFENTSRARRVIADIREMADRNLERIFMKDENFKRTVDVMDRGELRTQNSNSLGSVVRVSWRRSSYKVMICILIALGTIIYMIFAIAYK